MLNQRIPMEQIQIDKELLIRIGKEHDEHSISWEILKSLGDSLESLVQTIARYNKEYEGKIDINDFKLDFSGFFNGSPVPAFRLTHNAQSSIFNDAAIQKSVGLDFNKLMANINTGNYKDITDSYGTVEAKNEIIRKVYLFTNSAGTIPISVVKRSPSDKNKFKDVYRVRRLDKAIYDKLVTEKDVQESDQADANVTTAFAKVVLRQNKQGRTTKKTSALYQEKEATLSLKFQEIVANDRIYVLSAPVYFDIISEGKGTILEQEQLDLFAAGLTIEEAKQSLFEQFDHTYHRLNELAETQLSSHLITVKSYYNSLVKEIKN